MDMVLSWVGVLWLWALVLGVGAGFIRTKWAESRLLHAFLHPVWGEDVVVLLRGVGKKLMQWSGITCERVILLEGQAIVFDPPDRPEELCKLGEVLPKGLALMVSPKFLVTSYRKWFYADTSHVMEN
ncbi:MAG: hypothetical protein D6712_17755 [Chloroflexi bacterium]|nr:MAG: hypothetical protein D6712_17755 [Chloroflexota bacterium]